MAQQQYEQALARWNVAKSEVQVAKATLAKTMKELAQPNWNGNGFDVREDEVAALESQRDQLEAVLNEAESVLADLTIHAPANGTITTRMVDLGEVVNAGTPLFEIVDLDRLYLKVYVPEIQIGKIRLDLPRVSIPMPFPNSRSMQRCDTLPQRPSSPRKKSKLQTNA